MEFFKFDDTIHPVSLGQQISCEILTNFYI